MDGVRGDLPEGESCITGSSHGFCAKPRPVACDSSRIHALCGKHAASSAVKGMRGRQLVPPSVPGVLSRTG